jgi:(p)ppGpp synthase/HD superfamily hydrolase
MSTLEKAIAIAASADAGVKDEQGEPYVLHPLRVMLGLQGENAQIVGVLHDVVEDTDVSLDEIRRHGFSEEIIEALALVTHGDDQPYSEYVILCKENDIAREVKFADLRDNMRPGRLLLRPEKFERDSKRICRYALSYRFLSNSLGVDEYRRAMKGLEA